MYVYESKFDIKISEQPNMVIAEPNQNFLIFFTETEPKLLIPKPKLPGERPKCKP